jgi:hypothetical protein
MSDRNVLRLLSTVSIVFAVVLSVFALTSRFNPSLPGFVTFLFVGLIGSFAERSIRVVEQRLSALESRR